MVYNRFFLFARLVLAAAFIMMVGSLSAQDPRDSGLKAISSGVVKAQMEILASDWMEGRAAGTRGEYMAGDYIASMFRLYGLQPYGDLILPPNSGRRTSGLPPVPPSSGERSYFQVIPLVEYTPADDQQFSVVSSAGGGEVSADFNYLTDFSVRTGHVGITAEAPVVFAGYGFRDEKNGYDDFRKVDISGKVVVIMAGFPGHRDESSPSYKKFRPADRMAQYALERDKSSRAEKLGAVALIIIRPGSHPQKEWALSPAAGDREAPNERENPVPSATGRMALPGDTLSGNLPVFTVSPRVVHHLFSGTGMNPEEFEKQTALTMLPGSRLLPGKIIRFRTSVDSRIINARNVLAFIEGENKNEVIVVGGHYDHMGKSEGWIWNGADDNASGTVGVMTIAKAFAATGRKPARSVVFAAWTAEEKGLLGSEYFVRTLPDSTQVVINLNYDMIARNAEDDSLGNKASMMYTESWDDIRKVTAEHLSHYAIPLDLSYRPSATGGGGSDHAHFARKGIPIFYFMAAMHPDYHKPSDHLSKVNWDKMTDIIKVGFLNTWEFANRREPVLP